MIFPQLREKIMLSLRITAFFCFHFLSESAKILCYFISRYLAVCLPHPISYSDSPRLMKIAGTGEGNRLPQEVSIWSGVTFNGNN